MENAQDHGSRQEAPDGSGPRYWVVVNGEEQYSIWDARRDLPNGWQATGFVGPEDACLEHIEAVWTDMRPLSLRRGAIG